MIVQKYVSSCQLVGYKLDGFFLSCVFFNFNFTVISEFSCVTLDPKGQFMLLKCSWQKALHNTKCNIMLKNLLFVYQIYLFKSFSLMESVIRRSPKNKEISTTENSELNFKCVFIWYFKILIWMGFGSCYLIFPRQILQSLSYRHQNILYAFWCDVVHNKRNKYFRCGQCRVVHIPYIHNTCILR